MTPRHKLALVSSELQGCEENQETRGPCAADHTNGISGISGISSVDNVRSTDSAARDHRVPAIKCLTLYQPYASLVALGVKTIETRSWRTWYRGPLLIHAAKSFPGWARDLCKQEPFASTLRGAGFADPVSGEVDLKQLPLGAIVAMCTFKHCVRIGTPGIELPPPEPERSFGDYTAGRYAWILRDISPLREPIAAGGSMGLWVPGEEVLALLPTTLTLPVPADRR